MKCKCLNFCCCCCCGCSCGYLAERWARSDEFQDDGVCVFLDAGRNGPIHHDLTQFVASRSDVIHHHLVGRQFVFVRFAGAFASRRRLQLYPVTQLTDHLHPQFRLSSQWQSKRLELGGKRNKTVAHHPTTFKKSKLASCVVCDGLRVGRDVSICGQWRDRFHPLAFCYSQSWHHPAHRHFIFSQKRVKFLFSLFFFFFFSLFGYTIE